MPYRFTQGLDLHTTGFGNSVRAVVGIPTPNGADFGGAIVDFDRHPYIAKNGYLYPGGSDYPEQSVQSCEGVLSVDNGSSESEVYSKDYSSSPSLYGIAGEQTEFVFEVGYDSTVECSWSLDRVVFAYIDVEDASGVSRMENVACTQLAPTSVIYHMWGQTDSWGSEGEKMLSIPWQETR